jgi:glycosyltransferase involved in cell wall biosynthesis
MTKVLLLTWEYPPNIIGGLARHCMGLSESLVKDHCEVHVITTQLNNSLDFEIINGVNIHRIAPLHEQESNFLTWIAGLNLAMIQKAKELSLMHQFTIIHAHDWLVGSCALLLKKELKLPLIATIHSTEHGRNNGIHNPTQRFIHEKERQLIHGADQLIVCSEFMKHELCKAFSINEQDMVVIANGVESEEKMILKPDFFAGLPIDSNKKLIFSVGRMVREKGFATIIEAAPSLIRENPDLYFIIAGKGPMLIEYRQSVKEKGLDKHIFFVGYVTDEQKDILFQQCELSIFPSLYEPFGIVCLESMIYGKPTIVANTGGLKGIIKHMETGLLMVPGDKDSLIKQVQFFLNQKEKTIEIGENGKRKAKQHYSWKGIGKQTNLIYEETQKKVKRLQR